MQRHSLEPVLNHRLTVTFDRSGERGIHEGAAIDGSIAGDTVPNISRKQTLSSANISRAGHRGDTNDSRRELVSVALMSKVNEPRSGQRFPFDPRRSSTTRGWLSSPEIVKRPRPTSFVSRPVKNGRESRENGRRMRITKRASRQPRGNVTNLHALGLCLACEP